MAYNFILPPTLSTTSNSFSTTSINMFGNVSVMLKNDNNQSKLLWFKGYQNKHMNLNYSGGRGTKTKHEHKMFSDPVRLAVLEFKPQVNN